MPPPPRRLEPPRDDVLQHRGNPRDRVARKLPGLARRCLRLLHSLGSCVDDEHLADVAGLHVLRLVPGLVELQDCREVREPGGVADELLGSAVGGGRGRHEELPESGVEVGEGSDSGAAPSVEEVLQVCVCSGGGCGLEVVLVVPPLLLLGLLGRRRRSDQASEGRLHGLVNEAEDEGGVGQLKVGAGCGLHGLVLRGAC